VIDLEDIISYVLEFFKNPLSILIISFIGNAIPYIAIPYLAAIIAYVDLLKPNILEYVLINVLGGLGAGLGKIVTYFVGRGLGLIILSHESRKNLELFSKIASKGIFITVFLFAALPLPDDVLYIPLGMARYSILKFFMACTVGKIVITLLATSWGKLFLYLIGEKLSIYGIVIVIILTIMLTYLLNRIDWSLVMSEVQSYGFSKFIKDLIREPEKYLRK